MIKAAFFDVDGTLISHKISDIPPSSLQALYALHQSGVMVFLATGRHKNELDQLPLHQFPFDGYITLTGTLCYDSRFRPFYFNPIRDDDVKIIVELFHEKKVPIVLVSEDSLYINYVDETVIHTQADISTPVPEIGEYSGESIYMATAFGNDSQVNTLLSQLKECQPSRWHENGIDIISITGGKVEGIRKAQSRFGFSRNEIIAFGDGENDIDMIQHAGIGVAMGNASERLKAVADYVTSSVDEDGVLQALQHFLCFGKDTFS